MHRWTPVSSTVPWSTSTSQEVFHVGTNQPANREFELSPTKESSRSLAPAGSLVSIPHFVSLLVRDSSPWAGSSSVPLFQQMPTERVKW